jgi:hypothetical protein
MPKRKTRAYRKIRAKTPPGDAPPWVTPERGGRRADAKPRRFDHKPGRKTRYAHTGTGVRGGDIRWDADSEARIERWIARALLRLRPSSRR